jgi:hypothetical protein
MVIYFGTARKARCVEREEVRPNKFMTELKLILSFNCQV